MNAWFHRAQARGASGRERVAAVLVRQPSWVHRAAAYAALIAIGAIALLLLLLALAVAIPVLLIGALIARARLWFVRARGPNGVLDGRRNVRVIVRQEP